MPGLVINGKEVLVEGLDIKNWNDDKRLRRSKEDGGLRKSKWVKQVIVHTTKGIPGGRDNRPQHVKSGAGPNLGKDVDVAAYWARDPKCSGAHLIIDIDGSIACIADLGTEYMNHAAQREVNQTSIGIEMYQMGDAGIYEATLDACVKLVNALTEIFGIQRQVHRPYLKGPVKRLSSGGKDCVGVFGHRDVSSNRGLGDPGDLIFDRLVLANYELYDFSKNQDLIAWKRRQELLGVSADGIPGPGTVKALEAKGFKSGLWFNGAGQALMEEKKPSITFTTIPLTDEQRAGLSTGGASIPIPTPPAETSPFTIEEVSLIKKILEFLKGLFGGKK